MHHYCKIVFLVKNNLSFDHRSKTLLAFLKTNFLVPISISSSSFPYVASSFSFLGKFIKFSTLGIANYRNLYLIEFCFTSFLPAGMLMFYIETIIYMKGNSFWQFSSLTFSENSFEVEKFVIVNLKKVR